MIRWDELSRTVLEVRGWPNPCDGLNLPVVPQSIVQFSQLARSPNVSGRELAQPIELDSTLTSRLLKYVNSAAVGYSRRIHSVQQAISTLGIRRTKLLLLTAALRQAFRGMNSPLMNATVFYRESQERGAFARQIARLIGVDTDIAYTGAILQDLVLPVLTEKFSEVYRKFRPAQGKSLAEFERNQFDWDHARVAAHLMRQWDFPDELVCCVLFHHESPQFLSDLGLLKSSAAAVAAAGMLPDSLNQCPFPINWLSALQELQPQAQFLEAAVQIDDELGEGLTHAGNRTALSERLGALIADHLDVRGLQELLHVRQVGSYTLLELIGKGGMGTVYRGQHCHLERPAAVKLLSAQQLPPKSIEWFQTEAQLTSRLSSPNTVKLYDYGVTPQGVFYIVMEYIDGITLERLVHSFGVPPESRVIQVLSQVCLSLTEAHQLGLLHRDIKPDNIMLTRCGGVADFVKVVDFGLAESVHMRAQSGPMKDIIRGTPYYMSPETIQCQTEIDARSDLYSLGAVGYFLLSGRPPFTGNNLCEVLIDHVNTPPRPLHEVALQPVSQDLEAVIMRCLQKNPLMRPADALSLRSQLQTCRSAGEWDDQAALDWWSNNEPKLRVAMGGHPSRNSGGGTAAPCELPASQVITSDEATKILVH